MKRKMKNIVFDFDDILVYQAYDLYLLIRRSWNKYSRYFKDFGMLKKKDVYARSEFDFIEWLLKDEIKSDPLKNTVSRNVLSKMFKDELFSKNIYKSIEISEFCQKTLMNKAFMENIDVEKIYILTRNVTPEMESYKKDFINKNFKFKKDKIEMISVLENEKKSDVMKKLDWDLFVDDDIRNIRDVAENCNIENKEFMIPEYGYNQMPPELSILIYEKGSTFSYFGQNI